MLDVVQKKALFPASLLLGLPPDFVLRLKFFESRIKKIYWMKLSTIAMTANSPGFVAVLQNVTIVDDLQHKVLVI